MYSSQLLLPAYSSPNRTGYIFNFKIKFEPAKKTRFKATCMLSQSIVRELKRVLSVLIMLNSNWQTITGNIVVEGKYSRYEAVETCSTGLGIAIALFNLARKVNGSATTQALIGTGFVRPSGLIEGVLGLQSKTEAATHYLGYQTKLITAADINHLLNLEENLLRYC